MEHEERKIAKGYAIIALYTIILLVVGILLGFAVGAVGLVVFLSVKYFISTSKMNKNTIK